MIMDDDASGGCFGVGNAFDFFGDLTVAARACKYPKHSLEQLLKELLG